MNKIQHTLTPAAGKYDFDGQCAPHHAPAGMGNWNTSFTLGIFKWVPLWRFAGRPAESLTRNMLKRGKVERRVKGDYNKPEAAYDEARRICAELNA